MTYSPFVVWTSVILYIMKKYYQKNPKKGRDEYAAP